MKTCYAALNPRESQNRLEVYANSRLKWSAILISLMLVASSSELIRSYGNAEISIALAQGDPLRHVCGVLLAICTAFCCFRVRWDGKDLACLAWALGVFAGGSAVSCLLSASLRTCFPRTLSLWVYLASAFLVGAIPRNSREAWDTVFIFSRILLLSFFIGIILYLVVPDYAGSGNRLRGIFRYPNMMGRNAGLLFLILLAGCVRRRQKFRILEFSVFLFLTYCMVLSGSRSAILALIISLPIGAFLTGQFRWRAGFLVTGILAVGLIALGFVVEIFDKFMSHFSHCPNLSTSEEIATLTNRLPIWRAILEVSPPTLFGAGYGTFWIGWRQEAIAARSRFYTGSAHNAWLDLVCDLGIVGLVTMTTLLSVAAYGAWKAYRHPHRDCSSAGALWLCIAVYLLIQSPVETLFDARSISLWVLVALGGLCTRLCCGNSLPGINHDTDGDQVG